MFYLNEESTMAKACTGIIDSIKYMLNGVVYVIDTGIFMKYKEIRNSDSKSYIMPLERSVDIDAQDDFVYAGFLISRRK